MYKNKQLKIFTKCECEVPIHGIRAWFLLCSKYRVSAKTASWKYYWYFFTLWINCTNHGCKNSEASNEREFLFLSLHHTASDVEAPVLHGGNWKENKNSLFAHTGETARFKSNIFPVTGTQTTKIHHVCLWASRIHAAGVELKHPSAQSVCWWWCSHYLHNVVEFFCVHFQVSHSGAENECQKHSVQQKFIQLNEIFSTLVQTSRQRLTHRLF